MKKLITQMKRTISILLVIMMAVTAIPQTATTVKGEELNGSDNVINLESESESVVADRKAGTIEEEINSEDEVSKDETAIENNEETENYGDSDEIELVSLESDEKKVEHVYDFKYDDARVTIDDYVRYDGSISEDVISFNWNDSKTKLTVSVSESAEENYVSSDVKIYLDVEYKYIITKIIGLSNTGNESNDSEFCIDENAENDGIEIVANRYVNIEDSSEGLYTIKNVKYKGKDVLDSTNTNYLWGHYYFLEGEDVIDDQNENQSDNVSFEIDVKPGYYVAGVLGASKLRDEEYNEIGNLYYIAPNPVTVQITVNKYPLINKFMEIDTESELKVSDLSFTSGVDEISNCLNGDDIKFIVNEPDQLDRYTVPKKMSARAVHVPKGGGGNGFENSMGIEMTSDENQIIYTISDIDRFLVSSYAQGLDSKIVLTPLFDGKKLIISRNYSHLSNLYVKCSGWNEDKWVECKLDDEINIPSEGTIYFAIDVADYSNPSSFGMRNTCVSIEVTEEDGERQYISYPDEEWKMVDGHLCSIFPYEIQNADGDVTLGTAGFNFPIKSMSSIENFAKISPKDADIEITGIKEWNGYFFEKNTANGRMDITIYAKTPFVIPEFKYVENGVTKALSISNSETDSEGNCVYKYSFGYDKGYKNPEIIMQSESVYIEKKPLIAQNIIYDNNVMDPIFKLDSATGIDLEIEDGKVYIPYNHKLYIDMNVKDNCQVSTAKMGTLSLTISGGTVTTPALIADNSITFTGKELTGLYINDSLCSGNSYNKTVSKEKPILAYVKKGANSKYELTESMVMVKIGTKVYTKNQDNLWDFVSSEENGAYDTIKFDFSSEEIAGKTVTVQIKDGSTTLGSMTFKVTAYAKTVAVTGEKNGVITQDYGIAPKSYAVKFNTGVLPIDIGINVTAGDADPDDLEGLVEYDNGKIIVNSNIDIIESIVNEQGLEDVTIHFVDNSNGGAEFASKTLVFTNSSLAKAAPTVKVVGTSDIGINLELAYPKNFNYEGTIFHVKLNAAVDSKNPLAEGMRESVEFYTYSTYLPIIVAEDGVSLGEGEAQKYDISVEILKISDVTARDDSKDIPEIISWNKNWGKSKATVLKNQSTKAPYYETKLSATAKNANIYAGYKDVLLATAKFNAKTTYYDLAFELIGPDGQIVDIDPESEDQVCDISQGNINNIIIDDTTELKAGAYVLKVYPKTPDGAMSTPTSVKFNILEPVRSDDIKISAPGKIGFVANKGGSFTPVITYTNKPKTPKVTWSLQAGDSNTDSDVNCRKVTVDKKTGKVTVNKAYSFDESEEHTYILTATAADFASNDASSSFEFEIVNEQIVIGGFVYDSASMSVASTHEVYSSEVDGAVVGVVKPDLSSIDEGLVTFKSGNKKVADIDAISGELKFAGIGTTAIIATAPDGKKSQFTLKVSYKPYDEIGLSVNNSENDVLAVENENVLGVDDNYIWAEIKEVSDDDSFTSIGDLISYTFKVKNGGTIIENDGLKYKIIPTAATTVIELKNNYNSNVKTYTITNINYNVNGAVKLTFPTTFSPRTEGAVKATQLSAGIYTVKFISDPVDKNKKPEAYEQFEKDMLFDGENVITAGNTIASDENKIAECKLIAYGNEEQGFNTPAGKYNVYPVIIDGSGKIVYQGSKTAITIKATPKPTVATGASVKIEGRDGKTSTLGFKTKSNIRSITGAKLVGYNDNGSVVDANKYLEINYDEETGLIMFSAKEAIEDIAGSKFKSYVVVTYVDNAGHDGTQATVVTFEATNTTVSVDKADGLTDKATYTAVSKNMFYKKDYVFKLTPATGYEITKVGYYMGADKGDSEQLDVDNLVMNEQGQYVIPAEDMMQDVYVYYEAKQITNVLVRVRRLDKLGNELEESGDFYFNYEYNGLKDGWMNDEDDDGYCESYEGYGYDENGNWNEVPAMQFLYGKELKLKPTVNYPGATTIVKVNGVQLAKKTTYSIKFTSSIVNIDVIMQNNPAIEINVEQSYGDWDPISDTCPAEPKITVYAVDTIHGNLYIGKQIEKCNVIFPLVANNEAKVYFAIPRREIDKDTDGDGNQDVRITVRDIKKNSWWFEPETVEPIADNNGPIVMKNGDVDCYVYEVSMNVKEDVYKKVDITIPDIW